MAKKYKNIYFDKICSFDNLLLAYKKARKGKRNRAEVQDFEFNYEKIIFDIQEKLLNRNYQFDDYRIFTVYEPKERLISSAPFNDRVVHHAICNIIEPYLDKAMISDTYACRKGKGTHKALEKASKLLKTHKYILKLDIKKFFFTIDHKILLTELSKKIKDGYLLELIEKLLSTYITDINYYYNIENDSLLEVMRKRGLPIGNLTSQLFANFYLNPLDRFIKEELGFSSYIRYMDDTLIFSNNKKELQEAKTKIELLLEKKYRLKINKKKSCIITQNNGIKYLGFHLYKYNRRILQENLDRFKKRFIIKSKKYQNGDIEFDNILCSLNSWIGFKGKKKNISITNKILDKIKFKHPNKAQEFRFVT